MTSSRKFFATAVAALLVFDAVAIHAIEPSPEAMVKVYVREYFARTKAIIDLYILRTAPRHLGEKKPMDI